MLAISQRQIDFASIELKRLRQSTAQVTVWQSTCRPADLVHNALGHSGLCSTQMAALPKIDSAFQPSDTELFQNI
jgi:hypothetical protein